jgi:hypothetical protein
MAEDTMMITKKKYDLYVFQEFLLLKKTLKAIFVETLDTKQKHWIPASCLEYGLESFFKVGEVIEVMVCEWVLVQKEIV